MNKKEIINYLIFGVLTTLINIVVFYVLNNLFSINYQIANVISWFVSVLFAYITNKKYVFEHTELNEFKLITKFYGSRVSTLVLDMILMWLLVSILGLNSMISKLFVQFIVVISNYILSKFLIFVNKK